ncbi:flavin reductase family protein [Salininema proteolyticum]|uniref:Flavin reductase family protein n=1 Tax=Salininema proteolyticum TaxID=1607685 RepID=A0ABV8U2I6_9ACTN
MTTELNDLKVLYFGTPVVLLGTLNPDGTTNIAPMSSVWWLGRSALLGMGASSQTTANLKRQGQVVINLVPPEMAGAVNKIALLTGSRTPSESKRAKGYRFEADKYGAAGLTERESVLVEPTRVAESPIQLECCLVKARPLGYPEPFATCFEVHVRRVHVDEGLVLPGTSHIDPDAWDPLIMKFTEFYGGGSNVAESDLAGAWNMPAGDRRGLTPRTR